MKRCWLPWAWQTNTAASSTRNESSLKGCLTAKAHHHSAALPNSSNCRHSACLLLPQALQLVEATSYRKGKNPLTRSMDLTSHLLKVLASSLQCTEGCTRLNRHVILQEGSHRLKSKSVQPSILSLTRDPQNISPK